MAFFSVHDNVFTYLYFILYLINLSILCKMHSSTSDKWTCRRWFLSV